MDLLLRLRRTFNVQRGERVPEEFYQEYMKLEKLPIDLYALFMPFNYNAFLAFHINMNRFLKRAKSRDAVMLLQKKYHLPLRPNQSMQRCMVLIRIQELKKRMNNYYPPSEKKDE